MAQVMQQLGALSLYPPKSQTPLRVKEDRPAYGVAGKGFFDDKDKMWYPGQALYFEGEPNTDLIPLNKIAYEKMQAFLDKLDALGLKKAKRDGKEYIPQPRQEWHEDGVQDDLPTPDYVMGMKKDGHNEQIR